MCRGAARHALSHELFTASHRKNSTARPRSLADAQAMTPPCARRMEAQLVERLMTPPDAPSWGPDWVKRGEKDAPQAGRQKAFGVVSRIFNREDGEDDDQVRSDPLTRRANDDYVIARNMEKSRQVAHYRSLYLRCGISDARIALLAMFVDYQIIRGDVWTRALSNEFMVVPASLQSRSSSRACRSSLRC